MRAIFSSVMIIIGTLIGAGFASGQEIATFFIYFADNGLFGMLLSAIIFGIIIFLILFFVNKFHITKYEELIRNNRFILVIIKVFTFICFCIMISAIGAYGNEVFSVSTLYGTIFASIICFIFFLLKFSGLEKINDILVPFILIGMILLGIYSFKTYSPLLEFENIIVSPLINNWFLSALLYAGYNSILLIPILVELREYNLPKKDMCIIALLTSLAFSILGLLIFRTINIYYPEILIYELPTLGIVSIYGGFIYAFYSLVILFAIFTTAFSCGYAFLKMNDEKNYLRNAIAICLFSLIFSKIGFSKMINLFFPVFGFFGILQIIIIFIINKRRSK